MKKPPGKLQLSKSESIDCRKVAVLQSNYIPWKGYFDLINMVDEFILYDDVQYTRRDWRNRNLIKTPRGTEWLSIPVEVKGKYSQSIKDTKICDKNWGKKHYASLVHNYSKSRFFKEYKDFLEYHYLECSDSYLSEINFRFITATCELLGITTKITWSGEYRSVTGKNENLVELCKQAGADIYLSGPSARNYLSEQVFNNRGISVEWMDYTGYREHQQLYPPFVHTVAILDLILNEGNNSATFLKSFAK